MNIQPDKAAHFLGGMVLAVLLAPQLAWLALLLVAVVAAAKELWDRAGRGTYDPRDFWWTLAGGVVGMLIDLLGHELAILLLKGPL